MEFGYDGVEIPSQICLKNAIRISNDDKILLQFRGEGRSNVVISVEKQEKKLRRLIREILERGEKIPEISEIPENETKK